MAAACSLPHFMSMQVVMNSTSAMRQQPVLTSTAGLASRSGSLKSPQTQEDAQPGQAFVYRRHSATLACYLGTPYESVHTCHCSDIEA